MKKAIKSRIKKTGEAIGNKATVLAGTVRSTTTDLADNLRNKNLATKKKKLNPLFPEEYRSAEFHLPNLIVIVDDAVRRDEALCDGAIGWRSVTQEVEILYLYDEFINESGLEFIPEAVCDAAYYVDPHNRKKFIRIDFLFEWSQQEKLAELSNIAYCLGADRYSVMLTDKRSKEVSEFADFEANAEKDGVRIKASRNRNNTKSSGTKSKSLASVEFTETRDPVKPELCWFRNDRYIQELIRQRCEQHIRMNNVDIELSGTEYVTMSQCTCVKVDAAIAKIGLKGKAEMRSGSKEEQSHVMVFHLEFKKRGLFNK